MASVTAWTKRGSQSKSGKPWPRLTAPFSMASADMTVKMVVPTAGSFVCRTGVRSRLELIVVHVAGHGLGDEVAVKPVRQQFGELVDEVAQVGTALECDACHVLAEQRTQGPHRQVAVAAVVAHCHFGHDAYAQSQAHISLDDVGVDGFQRNAGFEL